MDIAAFLNECQAHHSTLQLDSFVTIREGMTVYGCYHQALRELNSRDSSIRGLVYQRAVSAFKAWAWGLIPFGIFKSVATFHHESLAALDRELSEMRGEQRRIYAQACALRRMLESNGVKFPLDAETRDRLDREMWITKLQAQAAVDLMVDGRIGRSVIEISRALPRDMKERLLPMLDKANHAGLIRWFMNYEPAMPRLFGIAETRNAECSELSALPSPSPDTSPMDASTSRLKKCEHACKSASRASIGGA